MNWEEAIQLYVDYEASVLSDSKKKTAFEKAKDRESLIRDLLSQMSSLASKTIEDITPQIWMDSRKAYMKKDRYHKTESDLNAWKPYTFLRACLVYAREDYKCHYCDAKDSDINVRFTVDHVIPRSQGGTEDFDNLVCCCDMDNRAKLNNPEKFEKWMKNKRQTKQTQPTVEE
jgi:5-methylcytosine-specific restriction endonuclease McrA